VFDLFSGTMRAAAELAKRAITGREELVAGLFLSLLHQSGRQVFELGIVRDASLLMLGALVVLPPILNVGRKRLVTKLTVEASAHFL
jgi:hypothetical protein